MGDGDAKIKTTNSNKLRKAIDSMLRCAVLARVWNSELGCSRGSDDYLAFGFQ